MTGLDKDALEAYQVELQLYEEELTKGREVACADEYIRRKVEAAERMAQDYGYMAGAGMSKSPSTSNRNLLT